MEAVHHLEPAEMQVLQYLAENRDRVVAEPELAQHVFGDGSRESVQQVSRLFLPVRLAVARQADIQTTLTHYRGRLAIGLRWRAKEGNRDTPTAHPASVPYPTLGYGDRFGNALVGTDSPEEAAGGARCWKIG